MKERPILLREAEVLAILTGRQTQIWRIVKAPKPFVETDEGLDVQHYLGHMPAPYAPGDRLWARETWALVPRTAYRCSDGVQQTLRPDDDSDAAIYRAGWDMSPPSRWRTAARMPRWASRLRLDVIGVRLLRLLDISEDTKDSIGGRQATRAGNPWAWAIEFRRTA